MRTHAFVFLLVWEAWVRFGGPSHLLIILSPYDGPPSPLTTCERGSQSGHLALPMLDGADGHVLRS
ncbi:MAG: hypothetical protein ACKER6_00850 [Candidatus Hodgkinia cicadicola]